MPAFPHFQAMRSISSTGLLEAAELLDALPVTSSMCERETAQRVHAPRAQKMASTATDIIATMSTLSR